MVPKAIFKPQSAELILCVALGIRSIPAPLSFFLILTSFFLPAVIAQALEPMQERIRQVHLSRWMFLSNRIEGQAISVSQ